MAESPGVSAFIRERQHDVLDRAMTSLADAMPDDVASVAHRLAGTLGTFDLPDAAALMRDLEDRVADPGCSADTRRGACDEVLAQLRRIAADLKGA